ncbi:transmembrane protein 59-like isoform X2 [Eublepharis macularius]|uniref:Transmembrane protein 59-like isoform X2 n=1 Tax=Eublepharis macularius TaxID=481883 RepID=A0AA97JFN8_EUBMA|nr:transmembrane protein 59-like isoform X2 [Eublepharis macularius]
MAGSAAVPWLALSLAFACASQPPDGDPFAPQLGDISACQARCAQSPPPPGAAAKDAVLNACYRGCRLFSICHFVDATAELNATRAECESACMEAYSGGMEQFGCMTGCRTQLPETESRAEKVPDLKPTSFSVFDLVSTFCNDIVSSAQSFISSTWTFYLQSDDGKVVVFQSQPEIEYPVPEVQAPKSEVSEKAWTVSNPNTMKPHTGLREKLEKPPVEEPKGKAKGHPPVETVPSAEHDFLGCMSKRSGLPRWILAACLFLSIMVMLWLSCASLVTAPDQHVKTQPLSINGDKEYLDDIEGPTPYSLRPVIAVAICPAEDSEEAGLLPVKVDLDKTAL